MDFRSELLQPTPAVVPSSGSWSLDEILRDARAPSFAFVVPEFVLNIIEDNEATLQLSLCALVPAAEKVEIFDLEEIEDELCSADVVDRSSLERIVIANCSASTTQAK